MSWLIRVLSPILVSRWPDLFTTVWALGACFADLQPYFLTSKLRVAVGPKFFDLAANSSCLRHHTWTFWFVEDARLECISRLYCFARRSQNCHKLRFLESSPDRNPQRTYSDFSKPFLVPWERLFRCDAASKPLIYGPIFGKDVAFNCQKLACTWTL